MTTERRGSLLGGVRKHPAGVLLFCFFACAAASDADVVVRIVDGDTLVLRAEGELARTVRIAEIDAPELRQRDGQWAAGVLLSLCPVGADVEARSVAGRGDRYGRELAVVLVRGESVGEWMVARGAAWVYPRAKKSPTLTKLEDLARGGRVGLWGYAGAEPPWDWRRRLR